MERMKWKILCVAKCSLSFGKKFQIKTNLPVQNTQNQQSADLWPTLAVEIKSAVIFFTSKISI